MLTNAYRLGWDFWGRAVIAVAALAALPIGISTENGRLVFGSLIVAALFGHLAYLRLREIGAEAAVRSRREIGGESSKND